MRGMLVQTHFYKLNSELSAHKVKLKIGFEMVFPGHHGLIASVPGTSTILAAHAHADSGLYPLPGLLWTIKVSMCHNRTEALLILSRSYERTL